MKDGRTMMVGSLLWLFGKRPPTSIHVDVDVRASLRSVKIITMGRYLDWHMRNQSMVMRLSHPEHRKTRRWLLDTLRGNNGCDGEGMFVPQLSFTYQSHMSSEARYRLSVHLTVMPKSRSTEQLVLSTTDSTYTDNLGSGNLPACLGQ